MQGDQGVKESPSKWSRTKLGRDCIEELFLIAIVADGVHGSVVGLEAQGRVELQRLDVETEGKLVLSLLSRVG